MAPKTGDTFTFKGVPDNEGNLVAWGNEPGAVKIGTAVIVREVVSADTSGAHTQDEDAVVVEWDEPSLGYEDGEPVVSSSRRAFAVSSDRFGDLFDKKGK